MKDKSVYLLIATCIAFCRAATAADWPNFRGPNHDGISSEAVNLGADSYVKPLWNKSLGYGCSSAAVTMGRLYTMANLGQKSDESTHYDIVYCLDAVTGDKIWGRTYKCGLNFKSNTPAGPFATPTVDGNEVYTFSRKGDVFCLNAATGAVIWHRDLKEELGLKPPFQGGFSGSPLILENMVILNAGDAGTALDKRTGKVIWQSDAGEAAQATPVPYTSGSRQCVAIFSGYGLIAVDAADGQRLWSYPWDTKYKTNVADPIIADNKAFISAWYQMGCTLLDISSNKPEVVWKNRQMQNHYNSCVLWKGCLYGFDIATLKCMDFATGRVKWSVAGLGRGGLIIAGGKLIVLSEKGELLIADAAPTGFNPVLRTKIIENRCYAGPVLVNGRIYARNDKGNFVCVSIESGGTK